MIAFASCVASPEIFTAAAARGLARVMEPDSVFAQLTTTTSILEVYNEALDHFSPYLDLEALVLLHEDTELFDPSLCATLRRCLRDAAVGVVGAIGARGVTSLAWWEGEMAGRVAETRGLIDRGFDAVEVDAVDGLLMALSPWAVRNLRFDQGTYSGFHAYDVDFCFAARAVGRKVVVADLPLMHHTKGGYGDKAVWDAADAAFRAKWLGEAGTHGVRATATAVPPRSAGPRAAAGRGAPGPRRPAPA